MDECGSSDEYSFQRPDARLFPGIRKVLDLDLVVGQFILIIHNGKDVLLAHPGRGQCLIDEGFEIDEIPFGEHPDHVLGLAGPRPLATPEHPEIVGAALDRIPPFPEVPVHEERAEELGPVGEVCKEGVEIIAFDLDPSTVEKVAGFFRYKPETVVLGPSVAALVVERPSFVPEPDPGPVKLRLHTYPCAPFGYNRSRAKERLEPAERFRPPFRTHSSFLKHTMCNPVEPIHKILWVKTEKEPYFSRAIADRSARKIILR
jgi:hypothetical protein